MRAEMSDTSGECFGKSVKPSDQRLKWTTQDETAASIIGAMVLPFIVFGGWLMAKTFLLEPLQPVQGMGMLVSALVPNIIYWAAGLGVFYVFFGYTSVELRDEAVIVANKAIWIPLRKRRLHKGDLKEITTSHGGRGRGRFSVYLTTVRKECFHLFSSNQAAQAYAVEAMVAERLSDS